MVSKARQYISRHVGRKTANFVTIVPCFAIFQGAAVAVASSMNSRALDAEAARARNTGNRMFGGMTCVGIAAATVFSVEFEPYV